MVSSIWLFCRSHRDNSYMLGACLLQGGCGRQMGQLLCSRQQGMACRHVLFAPELYLSCAGLRVCNACEVPYRRCFGSCCGLDDSQWVGAGLNMAQLWGLGTLTAVAGGVSYVSQQTGKVALRQRCGEPESPGEGSMLQALCAHSTGLLQREPSLQPGGCSRPAALPDPCDIESFGRENLVEKSKSCAGSCFDYLFLTSLQMEKIPLVNVYLLFSYCFIILSALSRDK